jgi:soluble lytic murein transglycosylase-like protein
MRDRYGLDVDPLDPGDNVMAGTAFLKEMYDRFGSPAFLAAYNAGPRATQEALSGVRLLPDESRNFMEKVGRSLGFSVPGSPTPAVVATGSGGLFFVLR